MLNTRDDIGRLHSKGLGKTATACSSSLLACVVALSGSMPEGAAKDAISGGDPAQTLGRAEDPKADAPRRLVDPKAIFVLEGMKAAKAEWKSGVCDIVFSNSREDAKSSDSAKSSTLRGKLTFVEGRGVRFDWIYPKEYALATFFRKPHDDVPIDSDERIATYIRTKNRTINWFQGSSNIVVSAADEAVPAWIIGFDPKTIGFASWVEFQRSIAWERLIAVFLKKPSYRVAEPVRDVYVLTWQIGSENNEWIVTVDANKGFSATHAEMRRRPTDTKPWRTVQEFKTTWNRKSSVWVPVRYEARNMQEADAPPRVKSMDLSWRDVNGSIPDDVFTVESLGAPDTVAVIDSTLGQPFVTKPAKRPFKTLKAPKPQIDGTTLTVVVANAVVVFFTVLWIVARLTKGRSDK